MDYLCAMFGDFSFSHFGFIVRTDRITDADDRYTDATTVVISDNEKKCELSTTANTDQRLSRQS